MNDLILRPVTPFALTKNLLFYVNKCGFHITRIIEDGELVCIFEKQLG